jgi:hypothetical protein
MRRVTRKALKLLADVATLGVGAACAGLLVSAGTDSTFPSFSVLKMGS